MSSVHNGNGVSQAIPAKGQYDHCKDVYAAIAAVRAQVPYVQKVKSGGLNYSFLNVEKLIEALRPELDASQLVIWPIKQQLERSEYTTGKGTRMNKVVGSVTYACRHIASGTSIDPPIEVPVEADDSGDKATHKAVTLGLKLALRQTFMVESGEMDPDHFASEQRQARESQTFIAAHKALLSAPDGSTLEKYWAKIDSHRTNGLLSENEYARLFAALNNRKCDLTEKALQDESNVRRAVAAAESPASAPATTSNGGLRPASSRPVSSSR